MSGSDDDSSAGDSTSAHVMGVKIGIIIGLFFLTLFAALLPLICVMLADRRRRRKEFYGASSGTSTTGSGGWCGMFRGNPCRKSASGVHQENNGNAGRSRSLRKRMSSIKINKRQSKRLLSCLNCFSGGIFLGTSLIGMLPEVREIFNAQNIGWDGKNAEMETVMVNGTLIEAHHEEEEEAGGHGGKLLPLAELVTVAGLFFILSIEQVAHVYNHWRLKRKKQREAAAQHESIILGNNVISVHNNGGHKSTLGGDAESPGKIELQTSSSKRLMSEGASTVHAEHQDDQHHDHHEIRSLMLVASLSIHSFLEGIAMGLQKKVASLTAIFVAVLFHKSLMAFSMGTNLVRSKQNRNRVLAASLIFALMSPAGMGTGLIIEAHGGNQDTENIPNAVFQAVATGTFLYITFFEVLVREFESSGDRLFKVISLIAGFTAVTLTIYAHHL